jgi:hypothetical protein
MQTSQPQENIENSSSITSVNSKFKNKPIDPSKPTIDFEKIRKMFSIPMNVQNQQYPFTIEICGIAKDENIYIDEWIDYHLSIGFDKITIFDDNSHVPLTTEKQYDIRKVRIMKCPDMPGVKFPETQKRLYEMYYHSIKNSSTYIAFIDIDEFFVLPAFIYNIKD